MAMTIYTWEIVVLLLITGAVETVLAKYFPPSLYLDLPLVFAVYIGWHSLPARAAVSGSLFGLVGDVVSGAILGLNGFSTTIVAFLASHLNRWMTFDSFPSRLFLLAVLTVGDSAVTYLMLLFLGQPLRASFWLNNLVRLVVTAPLGAVIFQIYDRVKFPRKDFRRLET